MTPELEEFIKAAGFPYGWENLESQARKIARYAVERLRDPHASCWEALAGAAEAVGAAANVDPSKVDRLILAIDSLSDAIMRDSPIDMVLHCPACGEQHVDEPSPEARFLHEKGVTCSDGPDGALVWSDGVDRECPWNNRPHRSHLCQGCGHVWRPADVATNGVKAIKTKGKQDSPPESRREVLHEIVELVLQRLRKQP